MVDRIRDTTVGSGDTLALSILSNVLASLLDGEAVAAPSADLSKYDGRVIRFELIGPDSNPFAAVRVSLVSA